MKKRVVLVPLLCLGLTSVLRAQAFQNLDFEDANLSVIPAGQFGGLVPITNALPYWTGYIGTNQVTQVLQNNLTLGSASIDILGPDWSSVSILQGLFSAVLQAGGANASLVQVGLIPTNAKSIFVEIAGTNFTMSVSGQTIPLTTVGSGSNYTLYGGDISAFAGLVEELSVSTVDPAGSGFIFDNITFSPESIPEPSSLSLAFVGVACLAFWRLAHHRAA